MPCAVREGDDLTRVLTVEELRHVWSAITEEAELPTAVLFKLYLWTAQRGGEIRSMQWTDVDLDTAWWVIPLERSKNKLAHRVPLLPPAVDGLRSLHRVRTSASPWVFVSPSKSGYRQIMHKAAERVRERSGVSFVPHDLRRTVATFLTSELGVSRLVVSKRLNHVESGITRSTTVLPTIAKNSSP
jgi:integrase